MGDRALPTRSSAAVVGMALLLFMAGGRAQSTQTVQDSAQPPRPKFSYPSLWNSFVPLPEGPSLFETAEYKIRVVTLVNGLSRPWSVAFLPDGNMLVTERTGHLRMVRNGTLDPEPVGGVPPVRSTFREGLMDIALHPRFAENRLVYLSYTKPGPNDTYATALARGRLDGMTLSELRDIFVTDWTPLKSGPSLGARIVFDRNGFLYIAIASPGAGSCCAQNPKTYGGKVLRLRDDGSVPPDNPFVGLSDHRPENFTLGHRSPSGLAIHPVTGALFETEHGPMGGDELNIIMAGKNYGWPLASDGRQYNGEPIPRHESITGMEPPLMSWSPAIAISGLCFYTGDRFPRWKGNVFVGSLTYNHLERIKFNGKGQPAGRDSREWMLIELKQRIRDVRQGPDGLLYLLTDADFGAMLRIEPAE